MCQNPQQGTRTADRVDDHRSIITIQQIQSVVIRRIGAIRVPFDTFDILFYSRTITLYFGTKIFIMHQPTK